MTENMKIWDAVSRTDPKYTKPVNQRGGFTAINANSQIMEATRQFGPIGVGWGYIAGDPIFHDKLVIVPVTLWHGDRSNTFGPVFGSEEWIVKDRVDSDAPKKAGTDGLTKCLSQLGFNADVFLGLYDDQKYVAQVSKEFADKTPPKQLSDASLKMIDAILACETLLALKGWKRDYGAGALASPDSVAITAAYNSRKSEIEHMDRSAA